MFASLTALALLAAPISNAPLAIRRFTPPAGAAVTPTARSAEVHLGIGLKMTHAEAIDSLLMALHDPASPVFRHWLTPQSFGEQFGLSRADYSRVAAHLREAGFKVKESPNRIFLEATGPAAAAERWTGVHLVDVDEHSDIPVWRTFTGTAHIRADDAPFIQSVGGLDTHARYHRRLTATQGYSTMGPQDLRNYYDIASLHRQGYTGRLSRVAVLAPALSATGQPSEAAIQWFYSNVSDSSATWGTITPADAGADTQPGSGSATEVELDSQMSTVAAPEEGSVTVVFPPASQLFTLGVNFIANEMPYVTAASVSFGDCEAAEEMAGDVITAANLFAQSALQGQAWFAAAGDDGTADCQDPTTGANTGPAVDFPGVVPYVTSVGGTEYTGNFDANDAVGAYGPEVVWNDGAQGGAGGGGVSTIFPRPPWQFVPGMSDGGFREVPDIALLASPLIGVAMVSRPGQIGAIGGTSDAAPMAAGMFALINDVIGGCGIGLPALTLYPLGRTQYGAGGVSVFHDITSGNNSFAGVTGPSAGPGYDEASGLGSIDVAALAAVWPPCVLPTGIDAGVPGYTDAGFGFPYVDGGPYTLLDAGVRTPYDPCAVLNCGATPGASCVTTPEGPSACVIPCNPAAANSCGSGNFCQVVDAGSGACTPGCGADSDCTDGQVCVLCTNTCTPPGNDAGYVGAMCNHSSDCGTGQICLRAREGFPDGYCTAACEPGVAACTCPGGSECDPGADFCFETCSVADAGCGRSDGYVCDPVDTTDVGLCFPACATDADCGTGSVCLANGVCTLTGPTGSGSASGGATGSAGGSTGGGSAAGTTGSGASTSSGGLPPVAKDPRSGNPDFGCSSSGGLSGVELMAALFGVSMLARRRRE